MLRTGRTPELTALCVVDRDGRIVREAKLTTDPEVIGRSLRDDELRCERNGEEAGGTSSRLCPEPHRLGQPAISTRRWR